MKYPIFIIYLKKEHIFTEQTLLIKVGTINFNALLPTRNRFFYADIIKCSHPGGNKFIECHFSIFRISEACLLLEVIEMFEMRKSVSERSGEHSGWSKTS